MKSNEVAGTGNHNTALFWEYDTRTARRWNIDPVKKHWESSYAVLSDNPIQNIDPLGNDDYKVTKKGEISKVNPTGEKTDRLISVAPSGRVSYDKKGRLEDPSMELDKGILDNKKAMADKDKEGPIDGWRLDFGDKKGLATKTFNFLSHNTDVEYTQLSHGVEGSGTSRSSIYTSRRAGSEKLSIKPLEYLANGGNTVIHLEYSHNHPRERFSGTGMMGTPSGSDMSDDHAAGDTDVFKKIWEIKPDANFYIREQGKTYSVEKD